MEGFDFTLSVVGWGDSEDEMRERILALFPEPKNPTERGYSVEVRKVKRLTRKAKP